MLRITVSAFWLFFVIQSVTGCKEQEPVQIMYVIDEGLEPKVSEVIIHSEAIELAHIDGRSRLQFDNPQKINLPFMPVRLDGSHQFIYVSGAKSGQNSVIVEGVYNNERFAYEMPAVNHMMLFTAAGGFFCWAAIVEEVSATEPTWECPTEPLIK